MILINLLVQIGVSMMATLSFAILFSAPKKEYLFCAITGAVGWTTYFLMTQHDFINVTSALCATIMLTLISRCLSVIRKVPSTIFLVTGIFPLVPGAGIYYTAYHLITNDMYYAWLRGLETFKIAGAIVLGIILGSALPQSWFQRLVAKKK